MTQRDIPVQPGETPVTAALRKLARIMDWAVTSTTNGAHSKKSYHYSGRAVDLAARSGPGSDTAALLAIDEGIIQLIPLSMISELIYGGLDNVCVQNGRMVNGMSVYGPLVLAAHKNHVHLAVIEDFVYNTPEAAVPDDPQIPNAQAKIVTAFPSPSGKGYTIITADGAVYCFGDAEYHGRLEAPTS